MKQQTIAMDQGSGGRGVVRGGRGGGRSGRGGGRGSVGGGRGRGDIGSGGGLDLHNLSRVRGSSHWEGNDRG